MYVKEKFYSVFEYVWYYVIILLYYICVFKLVKYLGL